MSTKYELLDVLARIKYIEDTLAEMVYEELGGWYIRNRETGEHIEQGEITLEEAYDIVQEGLNG